MTILSDILRLHCFLCQRISTYVHVYITFHSISIHLPRCPDNVAIQTLVAKRPPSQEVLQQVQHDFELRKNEHPVSFGLQFGQQFVQKHQFSAALHQGIHLSRCFGFDERPTAGFEGGGVGHFWERAEDLRIER